MVLERITKLKKYQWLGIPLFLILIFIWVTGFNGLYGQDSYEYLRYTKCLHAFFVTGINPGDYFWPLLYPLSGAIGSFVFSAIGSLQLISVLSLLLSAVYLEKILLLLFAGKINFTRLYICLFFLLCPYVLRASMVVMSDMLCVFFITASFYHFLVYYRTISNRQLLAFVFFSVAAVMTRYAAIILIMVPALVAGYTFLRYFNWKIFLAALGITFLLTLPHIWVRKTGSFAFLQHQWIESWSVKNLFSKNFNTADGHYTYLFPNIIYSFFNIVHPAFCFAGLILLIAAIKLFFKDRKVFPSQSNIILASVLLYAFFLAGISFQNLRFLLLSFPLVLILLFPGYKILSGYLSAGIKKQLLIVCCIATGIMQLGLFCRVFMPFYNDNKTDKKIAQVILKYPGKTVYTFSIDMALQGYGATNPVINLMDVKLDTVPVNNDIQLVLFNEKQFSQQWKDKNPMLNWDILNKQYHLTRIENLPGDWALYETR